MIPAILYCVNAGHHVELLEAAGNILGSLVEVVCIPARIRGPEQSALV